MPINVFIYMLFSGFCMLLMLVRFEIKCEWGYIFGKLLIVGAVAFYLVLMGSPITTCLGLSTILCFTILNF